MRTKADDGGPAVVTVEEVAYGLCALEWEIFADPRSRWLEGSEADRDAYRAKARFVLGLAESVPAEVLDRARGG